MKTRAEKLVLVLSLALVARASQGREITSAEAGKAAAARVIVLHTNDTHAHIDDGYVAFSEIAAEKARLEAAGEAVILADAGDHVQGTAFGGHDSGRSVIDIMNAAGYDVATLGNHEFDYGVQTLFDNIGRSTFRYACCNFIYRKTPDDPGTRLLPSYVVVTAGATRVAFVGVTTPTTLVSASPSTFLDASGGWRAYDFISGERGEALYAAVQQAVNEAAAEADYTVVVGHLGVSPDCAPYRSLDVIAHTTNFVAFIDGHSHSQYTGERVRNAAGREVVLAQSGCHLGILGSLTFEDGKCVAAGTVYTRGERNLEVVRLEEALSDAVNRQLGERVAVAPAAICSYMPDTADRLARREECAAGDFAADAAWWYASERHDFACDMALINGGNVRSDIPAGDVTLKTLRTVHPFGGNIGIVEANGRDILDALEFGARVGGDAEFGGFLQVAGLRYAVDVTVKSSVQVDAIGTWVAGPSNGVYRVSNVEVYDRNKGMFVPLDLNGVYRVVGNAFTLVEGGDGFAMFRSAKKIESGMATDYLVLAEYAKAFRCDASGLPHLASSASPLSKLTEYPLAYENPTGAGRITINERSAAAAARLEGPTPLK